MRDLMFDALGAVASAVVAFGLVLGLAWIVG